MSGVMSPSADTDSGTKSPQVILDLSRLVYAGWSDTPKGIPRVELAYAEHLLVAFANDPARLKFAICDAFGRHHILATATATRFIRDISRAWRQDLSSLWTRWRLRLRTTAIHVALLPRWRSAFDRQIQRSDGPSVYVIASQLHLEKPGFIASLKRTSNAKLIYVIHDIFLTQFPEFFPAEDVKHNRRRMENAARHADTIVFNSHDTHRAFVNTFASTGLAGEAIVAPLGVPVAASNATPPKPETAPYFVLIGTIEPRKNHYLILTLWQRLREMLGEDTPRLILIGERGWKNENVVDILENCTALRGIVEERGRLPDREMFAILAGARALLLPSIAEGYGLPLAEALATGTPALCSDVPALREVGRDVPEFLDPFDGAAWEAAIIDYANETSARRRAQLERLRHWQAPSWDDHFRSVDPALGISASPERPTPARTAGQGNESADLGRPTPTIKQTARSP
jgi:glycosyltransferase involved in cell wall biosynthesis